MGVSLCQNSRSYLSCWFVYVAPGTFWAIVRLVKWLQQPSSQADQAHAAPGCVSVTAGYSEKSKSCGGLRCGALYWLLVVVLYTPAYLLVMRWCVFFRYAFAVGHITFLYSMIFYRVLKIFFASHRANHAAWQQWRRCLHTRSICQRVLVKVSSHDGHLDAPHAAALPWLVGLMQPMPVMAIVAFTTSV